MLFAPDGCVRGNIRTSDFAVYVRAECEHVKIRGAVIILAATDAAAAASHVATWLRIPQNHVIGAWPAEGPAAEWIQEVGYTGRPAERT